MKSMLRLAWAALLYAVPAFAESPVPPGQVFHLSEWKLQIPGPKEVKDLRHYSSEYFYLNAQREMCFHLDAAEKGHTKNTKFVRSELRHNVDWKASERHTLSGEFRVESQLTPDKVTLLQIHGITDQGDNAPPFLRIAVNQGNLYAMLKNTDSGEKTESVLLKRDLKSSWAKVVIAVGPMPVVLSDSRVGISEAERAKHTATVSVNMLTITVDGVEKLHRDVSYWKYSNYFKAGIYPQATEGSAVAYFRELKAE